MEFLRFNFGHPFKGKASLTQLLSGKPQSLCLAIDSLLSNIENTGQIENYAGKTSLEGLCELMASSAAVLTTDSGPAHLANALGTPTIVLFGAGNEQNTAPYNKQFLTVIRAGRLACEPCVRNTCKLYGIPKCMQLIDELEIVNALSFYL